MKLLQKRHRLHGAWDMAAPCWKAGLAGQGLPAISRQILCFARLWEKDGGRRCWMSIAKGRVTCSKAGSAAFNGTVAQRTSPWAWAERSCQAHQFCIAAPDAVARKGAGMPGQQALTPRAQGRHENREDTGTGPQTLRQCHWYGLRAGPHQNLQGAGAVVRLCLQACSRCPGSMSATSGLLMGRAFPCESEALRVAPCRRSPLGPVDNPRWPSDPAHQEPGSP